MGIVEFNEESFLQWARSYADYESISLQAKKAFDGWDVRDGNAIFDKLEAMLDIGRIAINMVEKYARDVDALSNKDKLDAAVKVIDDWIKLPRLLEWADQIAIRYALSAIVNEKNNAVGKDWFRDD